jgi:hypothetical protein
MMHSRHILPVIIIPFAFGLILYVSTLAPTVTFEDSGEFATAAYVLGVPHPPGYPVFCMVGKIFTLMPLRNVAWRLNLMSALFMAAAAGALSWAALLVLERVTRQRGHLLYASAIAAGIMMATASEVWQQAVITEVYALSTFVAAVDLLLLLLWDAADPQHKPNYFYALCFTLGLGVIVHPTAVIMIPVVVLFFALTRKRFLLNGRRIAKGAGCFALGLLPLLYLPIAARAHPIWNFGDPENLRNLILVASRRLSYRDTYSLAKAIPEVGYYFSLLSKQWFPLLLVPAVLGFAFLFRRARAIFWVLIAFFVLGAPAMSVITNYDISAAASDVIEANKWNVSVFYILSYVCLSLAAAVGYLYMGFWLARAFKNARAAAVVLPLIPAAFVPLNYAPADMSHYTFASDYSESVFDITDKGCLILTEHDPEFFPLLYYQSVEGKRPDIVMVNRLLLQRSWYVQFLKYRYPDLVPASSREAQAFLRALEPFEAGKPYNGYTIQAAYEALINSFIDRTIAAGRSVYLTFAPSDAIAPSYEKESLGIVLKLRNGPEPLTPLVLDDLKLGAFEISPEQLDFPARYMQDHFARFLRMRANELDLAGQTAEARRFYLMAQHLGG